MGFRASFAELGDGDVTILACNVNFNPPEPWLLGDGLVTAVLGSGVLSGIASGSVVPDRVFPPPQPPLFRFFTHLDIEFTGGTGALAGATGTATYDRIEDPNPFGTPITSNRFAGSVTVPGT